MANRVAAAALQFSKWLSRAITWYWMFYRTLAAILSTIRPEAAGAIMASVAGVDQIMIINEGTYLINSLGEKYIYSDKFVMRWFKDGAWKTLLNKAAGIGKSEETEEESEG